MLAQAALLLSLSRMSVSEGLYCVVQLNFGERTTRPPWYGWQATANDPLHGMASGGRLPSVTQLHGIVLWDHCNATAVAERIGSASTSRAVLVVNVQLSQLNVASTAPMPYWADESFLSLTSSLDVQHFLASIVPRSIRGSAKSNALWTPIDLVTLKLQHHNPVT